MNRRSATLLFLAIFSAACSGSETAKVEPTEPSSALPKAEVTQAPDVTFDVLAFGDAADCRKPSENVAKLVDATPGEVIIAGDLAYPAGSQTNFDECFSPLYESSLNRMHAVPGDNDYKTDDAAAFFNTLDQNIVGEAGKGWWSFTREGWQIIGINSECSKVNCGPESEQYAFVAEQLAAEPDKCRMAVWHKPRFTSSANYQGLKTMDDLYRLLYDNQTDILVVGNSHHYERFEPLNPEGTPDEAGIANFTVGTGGAPYTEFGEPLPGSAIRNNDTRGVVKFTMDNGQYSWEFLSAGEGNLEDSGSAPCHNQVLDP